MSLVKIRAALETALDSMPGIIPSVGITSFNGTTFTTSADHNLLSGLAVTVSGNSSLNGTFEAVVLGPRAFSILDPVTEAPVTGSAGTGGTVIANLTAWENMNFPKKASQVPYQKVWLLAAQPENPTFGGGHYREVGIMQITLVYPMQLGTGDAVARADLIRSTFPRGASFSNSGVVVNINRTPEIFPGTIAEESYELPVRVSYWGRYI
jgi:hypothetical protein